jgi:hypothetical protein
MIDQDQARKFWTSWVRREIGGSDMIQGAAVSAAVNELLLGHDNVAAADAARTTARQLGGGVSTPHAQGGKETVATPPRPAAPGGAAPIVASRIAGTRNPGTSLLRRPWLYLGGVAGIAATALVVIFIVRSAHSLGCLVSQTTLGHRMTTLHNAFVDVYNRDFNVIDACTSVDCEKAPKLEIAASLKTYNDGLDKICWPSKYTADVTALKEANSGMADAFTTWATATTPAEDNSLETAAKAQDAQQGVADDALSRELGVPVTTPTPTAS